jgi:hypothetical protein
MRAAASTQPFDGFFMTNHKYEPIPKLLGDRIQELLQALQVIRDSLEAVRQGKLHQIIPVYGQLRALLSEKSKGNDPLLLTIAEELGEVLEFYSMPAAGELPDELKKNLVLHLSGFPVGLEQELPSQIKVSTETFLNQQMLIYNGRPYLVKDIIAFFANKAGGAHYSPDLPKDFAELMSFGLSGQPVLVNALLQIAEVTYRLGVKLLKSQADFEVHTLLYLPHQELKQPAYIIDNVYPDTSMRVFCRAEPGMKFSFGVTSIQGLSAIVGINRLIDWTIPHHFTLSLVIENDLSTKLAIALDGETVAKLSPPHPLFVASDPLQYKSYQNRSHEDSQAGLDLALIEMAMFGKKLPVNERAQMFLYFENQRMKEDLRCVYFKKGQYGIAPPGTNDMQMTNSPVMWSVGKLLKGEFPKSNEGSV